MILYKYVDLEGAEKIIENSTIKFSKASSFNDPFELTSLHYGLEPYTSEQLIRHAAASTSYGILSLTRNPLNPLMWAHYGKGKYIESERGIRLDRENHSHAGFVFGIDAEEADLDSVGSNVIPAKYGNVIYTATKPKHPFENSDDLQIYYGMLFSFDPDKLEALQRTFLYKSSHWSYEEEVRIIRNIDRGCIRSEIQPIVPSAFKEIYVGIRNAYNKSYLIDIKNKVASKLPSCNIFVCWSDEYDWKLNKIPIDEAISKLMF